MLLTGTYCYHNFSVVFWPWRHSISLRWQLAFQFVIRLLLKFQLNPPNSDLRKTCSILLSIQFLMTARMSDQQYCNFANSNTNHSYFKQRWLLKLNLESSVVIVIMLTWSDATKGGHQYKRCKYLQSMTSLIVTQDIVCTYETTISI